MEPGDSRGVSAGLDFALALAARGRGDNYARTAQLVPQRAPKRRSRQEVRPWRADHHSERASSPRHSSNLSTKGGFQTQSTVLGYCDAPSPAFRMNGSLVFAALRRCSLRWVLTDGLRRQRWMNFTSTVAQGGGTNVAKLGRLSLCFCLFLSGKWAILSWAPSAC